MDDKKLYVHALMGGKKPKPERCEEFTRAGLMRFTGNQHNMSWDWVESEVTKLPYYAIRAMYYQENA